MSSRCEPCSVDAPPALRPTNSTTKACNESCNRRRVWRKFSIPIRICCRCPDAWRGRPPTQPSPSRHFAETAAITPEQRAETVKKIVAIADKHKLTTAGIFSTSEISRRYFQFSRPDRLAHADFIRDFHHHARPRFFGLAESQFPERRQSRRRRSRRNRRPQGVRVRQPARDCPRKIHRHPRTRRRARHRRLHVLRLRRTVHSRPAIVS